MPSSLLLPQGRQWGGGALVSGCLTKGSNCPCRLSGSNTNSSDLHLN